MDEQLREQLRILAEQRGLKLEQLEAIFSGDHMPKSMERAVESVLGDVELFDLALRKLKEPDSE